MSRSTALILLGVLSAITPLSGLPQSWIAFLIGVFGVIVALIGIALRADNARHMREAAFAPSALPTAETSPAEPEVALASEPHAHHDHHRPSSIA